MQVLLFPPRLAALVVILLLAHVIAAAAVGFTASASPPPASAETDQRDRASTSTTQEDSPSAPGATAQPDDARAGDMVASLVLLGSVLAVCLLEALAIAVLLLNAQAHGWRLIGGLWVAQFGVMTLQPQIEALAFGVIDAGPALRILGMGLVMATLVAPLSVLVFWRIRPRAGAPAGGGAARRWRSARFWVMVAIAAALYVVLYLVCGYFIAWRSPEVREYYGGDSAIGFWPHMWALQTRVPWFLPFQWLRGCLWAVLGGLILALLRGPWWRAGAVLGLFFAVVMNAQLLLPNPLMPEAVRLVHILETAPCNLVFGIALAWMLDARPARRAV